MRACQASHARKTTRAGGRNGVPSGVTVPIGTGRVLSCATKYFDGAGDEKEGLMLVTAMLQKSVISTRAKKPNAMLAEMVRARVSWEFDLSAHVHYNITIGEEPLSSATLEFLWPPNHFNTPCTHCSLIYFFTESCLCDDYP